MSTRPEASQCPTPFHIEFWLNRRPIALQTADPGASTTVIYVIDSFRRLVHVRSAARRALCSYPDEMSTRFTPPLPDDPSPRMSTKVIFTRNSPLRTVLVDETTGRELYRINTPRKFVGSVTRVFRCDPAAPPVPNLVPPLHWDANDPSEDDSDGNEGAVDEAPGEDSPFVENEIARLYWKWFASPRIVFDGKIRRRTEFMPLKGRYKK